MEFRTITIAACAAMCVLGVPAQGQRLPDVINGLVKTQVKQEVESLINQGVIGAKGGDPTAKPEDQFKRDNWNNRRFTPTVSGDGYSHIRFGSSDTGPYKFGVPGRPTCDGAILLSVLTQRPMAQDKRDACARIEAHLQQLARERQQTPRSDWAEPSQMVEQRRAAFNQMPLKLYFRFSMPGNVRPEQTPEGLFFYIGQAIGSTALVGVGSAGASDEPVDITLRGPGVVYEFDSYLTPNVRPSRQRNSNGVIRVFTRMDREMEFVLARNNQFSAAARNSTYDTVYYTIHSVKQIAPRLGNRPHYEIEITVDKLSFAMEATPGEPGRVLNLK